MMVKLKKYKNPDLYHRDYPEEEKTVLTIKEALKEAKEEIAKRRGTNEYIGFKIFNKWGEVVHKLPSN